MRVLEFIMEALICALAVVTSVVIVGSAFQCLFRVAARHVARLAREKALLSLILGAMALVGVVTGFAKTNGADRVGALLGGVRHLLVGGVDVARISAINVDAAGVDVVLHRPPSQAGVADEVALCGSTNLVAATWESYANVLSPAGVTNVPHALSRATLEDSYWLETKLSSR